MSDPNPFHQLRDFLNEQMALMFEQDGFSPLVGRIFSLLLFASEPVSIKEMGERLGVTKAAVSIQVRTLEKSGMCFKLARSNDRKDYYYIADDFSLSVVQASTQKMQMILHGLDAAIKKFPSREAVPAEDFPSCEAGLRRFKEMRLLYQLISDRLDGLEEEWKKRREQMLQE